MRPRTARAVEPNAGIRAAYKRSLLRLKRDFADRIMADLLLDLDAAGALSPVAEDAALDLSRASKELIARVLRRARKSRAVAPDVLAGMVERAAARRTAGWLELLRRAAARHVERFVRRIMLTASGAQMAALVDAGAAAGAIRRAWEVPTARGQYISPQARRQMPEIARDNAALITRIGADDVARISGVFSSVFSGGGDYEDVRRVLAQTRGMDEARVNRIVLDQANKISQDTQRANCQSLGITEGIWVHVPGQYTSRETHMDFDGRRFLLNAARGREAGLFDTDVNMNVVPGQLPFCRCIYRAVIPEELLGD